MGNAVCAARRSRRAKADHVSTAGVVARSRPRPIGRHALADRPPARARDLIVELDRAVDDLIATRAAVTEAVIRANRDAESGFGTGGTGETVAQSAIADRATAERALAHWHGDPNLGQLVYEPDAVARNARKMVDAIGAARAMAQLALRAAQTLLPLSAKAAQALAGELEGSPSICANCGCNVWRTPTDRLLAGRCRNCYEYRRAHDGIERPRELWADDEPKRDPRRNARTVTG